MGGLGLGETLEAPRLIYYLLRYILTKGKEPLPMLLSVNRIQFPAHYIRDEKGKVNREVVKEWTALLKERGRYFFPPIEVWIPPDGLREGMTHELIDGAKRFTAAKAAGLDKIPAVPLAFKKPEDAFARQFVANAENGEFLTKEQRNNYVRVMRTVYKLNLAAIARITKLSKGQVSRIARGIKATKRETPGPSRTFSARGFLDDLANLCDAFHAREKSVCSFLRQKYGEPFTEKVSDALDDLREALAEALKEAKTEAAGQEA